MLSLKSQAWFLTFCVCCFAMTSSQAQTNGSTNSTQEESSEHSLIANYSTSTENAYNFGGYNNNYLYSLGITSTSTTQASPTSNHQDNNEAPYSQAETSTDSQDFSFSSFVDEILDIPSEGSTNPQHRVVPVATVEDIHGISTKERLDKYNNGATIESPNPDNTPTTRVVPVATVEDVHGISTREKLDRFNNGVAGENFNPNNTPTTRVVPVATVEDVHGISTREKLDRFNNGVADENFNPNNTPTTRVVPVATVEDVHKISRTRDHNAYQPYRNSNPVVRPSQVKEESNKERKQRYSNYSSNRYSRNYPSSKSNTDYSTIQTKPRPKKGSFGQFIRKAFKLDEYASPSYRNNEYSERNEHKEKKYRSDRSSSSSREYTNMSNNNSNNDSKEYKRVERESRKTDNNNTTTRSNRNQ